MNMDIQFVGISCPWAQSPSCRSSLKVIISWLEISLSMECEELGLTWI